MTKSSNSQTIKPILHLSALHGGHDSRVVYREGFSLAKRYNLTMVLTRPDPAINSAICFKSVPYQRSLWKRLFLVHPRLLWQALRSQARIIHFHEAELIPIGLLLCALGRTVIYDVHENLHRQLKAKRLNNSGFYRWFFRVFDRLAQRYFYLIFAENSYRADYQNLRKPYAVILNYPSLPLLDPHRKQYLEAETPPGTDPEFFYIGQLSLARCLDVLINALAQLKTHYPNFRMHLFGPFGFDLSGPEELAQLPGYERIKTNLTFYGPTDAREAFAYAARCVAGLALLRPVGDFPTSYPTKIFEYMALELPVITSDFPLYRSVVETHDCGFCLDPTNADALFQTLKFLVENPEIARQMGVNGRKAVEKSYDWAFEEQKLFQFYEQVAS
ncbi:MAG: glycosyltransferase [Cytophagaceae bacterium]|nr:glycosyltransferase [Cytophagaceae bacterium]